MKSHGYTYQNTLAASERIHWRVEDLIGGDKRLDFSKPFMPESFARVEPLTFLSEREKLALNHIRALGYLYTFGTPTSHVAILARSLGLPAVVGLRDATARLRGDETVVLDGSSVILGVNPSAEELAAFRNRAKPAGNFTGSRISTTPGGAAQALT